MTAGVTVLMVQKQQEVPPEWRQEGCRSRLPQTFAQLKQTFAVVMFSTCPSVLVSIAAAPPSACWQRRPYSVIFWVKTATEGSDLGSRSWLGEHVTHRMLSEMGS